MCLLVSLRVEAEVYLWLFQGLWTISQTGIYKILTRFDDRRNVDCKSGSGLAQKLTDYKYGGRKVRY